MTLSSFENLPHDKTLKLTDAFSLLMKEIDPHHEIKDSNPSPCAYFKGIGEYY